MKNIFLVLLVFLIIPIHAAAKRLHYEKWYQNQFCEGEKEVVMPDNTRCDCVTSTHAIEFDFADKWCEALGQSLNYGFQTGKKPGIYLIIEKDKDRKHLIRLNSIINHYRLSIDTWEVSKEDFALTFTVKKSQTSNPFDKTDISLPISNSVKKIVDEILLKPELMENDLLFQQFAKSREVDAYNALNVAIKMQSDLLLTRTKILTSNIALEDSYYSQCRSLYSMSKRLIEAGRVQDSAVYLKELSEFLYTGCTVSCSQDLIFSFSSQEGKYKDLITGEYTPANLLIILEKEILNRFPGAIARYREKN